MGVKRDVTLPRFNKDGAVQLTLSQKIQSFFYPVLVRKIATPVNPVLELYAFKGRWQLATSDALYSDGDRYRPLLAAFQTIGRQLPEIKEVLVLGTGLGSAVSILGKQGFHPHFTLVELDKTILEWALELLPSDALRNIKPVCANAADFIATDTGHYDLIITDIFIGRKVPDFVLSPGFLKNCRERLTAEGQLVLNYMVTDPNDKLGIKPALEAVFGEVKELAFHLNRIYFLKA